MPESTITWYPDRKDIVAWETSEVIRDVEGRQQLMVRLELTGVHFAHRALEPFMRVGDVRSRVVLIDPDGRYARGYFDRQLPDRGEMAFGYGEQTVLVIHDPYRVELLRTLDPRRLPDGTRHYDVPDGPRDRSR